MQTNSITLKKVTIAELEDLQQIGRTTFREAFASGNTETDLANYLAAHFSIRHLREELENPESVFYFAKTANQIIGYLKINTGQAQTEQKGGNALEIERIYVLKAFYGKKVGQLLLQKALEIAHKGTFDFVWLGVWEKNLRAIQFYKKNGFVIFDQHLFQLGSDIQTDLLMKLQLNP